MKSHYDIAVVGAGIAGASIAAELAPHASVLLIEAEDQPGYHATGRSAAFWSETYGGPLIQPLTSLSGPFLKDPPAEFHSGTFLHPRGCITIADEAGKEALDALLAGFSGSDVALRPVGRATLEAAIPGLRAPWRYGASEPGCMDIDVAALHGAYLRAARRAGADILTGSVVERGERQSGRWLLAWRGGAATAATIVNAAGGWADEVAARCGIAPLDIRPFRRTMVQLKADPPVPPDLPLIMDALGRFYFKPEAGGRLWLSPHDETACPPCDAAPEELDVARAIAMLQEAVTWRVDKVERKWAGLRSFAPDRLPVYGFSDPGFFWFAGQGGFGIQTAPAAAKLSASLLLGLVADSLIESLDPGPYTAQRFRN
jgi:D-arginine dehydrogenase